VERVPRIAVGSSLRRQSCAHRAVPCPGIVRWKPVRPDLRDPLQQLHAAVRQIEVGGDATQLEAAANVLVQARRSLYLILAGEAEDVGE
jgi:hypothetical protein